MRKTYKGSCHCGLIRFECDLELGERTSKCKCSICTKSRFWKAIARAEAFRLVQEADALTDYQFGGRTIHHQFCSRCGVKPFGRGTWTSPTTASTPTGEGCRTGCRDDAECAWVIRDGEL